MIPNHFNIQKRSLEDYNDTSGVVVVIDVLRAFTTTAFAFDRGAREIQLVASVDEAFARRKQDPGCRLMGEVNGLAIDGFDLPNSPANIDRLDLSGQRLVMRTTAGTQGVVLAAHASELYVASLSVASATARRLRAAEGDIVTFIETGRRGADGGEEDVACADLITGLLTGEPVELADIRQRVIESRAAHKFRDALDTDFPRADLERALEVDRFDFAMKVETANGRLVLKPV